MPSDIVHELTLGLWVVANGKVVKHASRAQIIFEDRTSLEVVGPGRAEGNFQGDGALAISATKIDASVFRDRASSFKLGTLNVGWEDKGSPNCNSSRVRFGDGSEITTSGLEGAVLVDYVAGGTITRTFSADCGTASRWHWPPAFLRASLMRRRISASASRGRRPTIGTLPSWPTRA